ncbi:phage terminase large subunit [Geobacillus kaustophilus]|uniref:Phage terminase large subunit n=1 Tax=Geobacillus kaustophilus TaxID=1462 RepID=A0A0D8BQN4_GEOKU|nr:phage terminase large subunit [Geobacillus kaustophilus]KJE26466.1 phage terminase large subunit [Geobacillus kaustophilus]
MTKIELTDLIAPSFYEVHHALKEERYTHYWLKGGRGSTKSSFISIEIILGMMCDPNANAVALRKVKENLRESVFEQLLWAIEVLGVSHLWHDSVSPMSLTYLPTSQKIIFRGADKPKKVKSSKLRRGYIKYVWYEEVDEFLPEDIRTINQTFLRGGPKFVVFYSFNPTKSQRNWVNAEELKGVVLGDDEEQASQVIQMLKKYKVLELPPGQDADAEWLVKSLNESDTEVLRNAIRDDIHQFAMVPNLTDENFAANASGVAMKYKLLGLEQLAKIKERYFIQGLRERLKLFANVLKVKGKAVDVSDVTITMTRNLPANDLETAQMIATLNGMVSTPTLISQLSFVHDPQAEVDAVNAEKEDDIKRNQAAFGVPMNEDVNADEDAIE